MTVLPGSTLNITWTFKDKLSDVYFRAWFFTSSDGSFVNEPIATIFDNDDPEIYDSGLSGISIAQPATLRLKNVNQTYDGTYRFDLISRCCGRSSRVVVFIASKF